jgi:surface polysaccharide O-acyltransferase-like enzyme
VRAALLDSPTAEPRSSCQTILGRGRERVEGYDLVRFFASINVVLFHILAVPDGLIGRGGIPAFLMIAGSLPAMHGDLGSFGNYARRRGARILGPWLFWSAFYAVVAAARYARHGTTPQWTVASFIVGSAVHLWFFPAIFLGTLCVWILLKASRSIAAPRLAIGLATTGALLLMLQPQVTAKLQLNFPIAQWVFSVPAMLIGVALGLAARQRHTPRGKSLILLASALTIAAAIVAVAWGEVGTGISYGLAGLCVPATLVLPLRSGPFLRGYSQVSLGVYASHPFIFLLLGWIAGPQTLPAWLALPVVVTGAILFSKLLRHAAWGRAVV